MLVFNISKKKWKLLYFSVKVLKLLYCCYLPFGVKTWQPKVVEGGCSEGGAESAVEEDIWPSLDLRCKEKIFSNSIFLSQSRMQNLQPHHHQKQIHLFTAMNGRWSVLIPQVAIDKRVLNFLALFEHVAYLR